MNALKAFLWFLKAGTIGFAGGSAFIPVVEKIIVGRGITSDEYLKHTVIANITPGALPVKLGATCGYQMGGIWGAIGGAVGVALPGALLTVLITSLFAVMGSQAISYLSYASVGITAFIIYLLSYYVYKTVKSGRLSITITLCLLSLLLTFGGEIRSLLGIFGLKGLLFEVPIFNIATIDLMVISFFAIVMVDKVRNFAESIGVGVLVLCYSFLSGDYATYIDVTHLKSYIAILMVVLVAVAYRFRRDKDRPRGKLYFPRPIIITAIIFVFAPILMIGALLAFGLVSNEVVGFSADVALSTLTSFGGGAAYISVADGFFVQTGLVDSELFYSQIVPVANSMPGPILLKVVAGIGYLFAKGGVVGLLTAAAVTSLAVGSCSAVSVLVMSVYDSIKESPLVNNLKRYILPVICGMLVSTSISMAVESSNIAEGYGFSPIITLAAIVVVVPIIWYFEVKYNPHDLYILLLMAALSLGAFLAIQAFAM